MAAKTAAKNADMSQAMGQLDTVLNEYLVKKAPALPQNLKELIVKFGPYLVIVGLVFSVPALLSMLGVGAALSSSVYWAMAGYNSYQFYLMTGLTAVVVVLEALAVPGLLSRSKKGWNLMYYAALVGALSSLLTMNLIGLVVGTLLSLYVLFQVRSMYR